jgi:hypothetical protein
VNFYSGTTLLGQGTLNSSGVATYATTTLAAGQDAVTAQYAGDPNFNASTSSAVSVTIIAPTFAFTLPSQSFTVSSGQSVQTTMTLTSTAGYSGTITFSCSNLPVDASCIFHPSPITLTPAITLDDISLTVTTSKPASSGYAGGAWSRAMTWFELSPCLLCVLMWMRRRKILAKASGLLAMCVIAFALAALSGCGSSAGANSAANTPPGTTTFTVSGTDGTQTQSSTVTLTVQ